MKVLVVVNAGPWSGSLAVTALRLVRALLAGGETIDSVHFRHEGAYHALAVEAGAAGAPDLHAAWRELAGQHGFPLLLCASASARRLDSGAPAGFRHAGLPELFERMAACDRVVTF